MSGNQDRRFVNVFVLILMSIITLSCIYTNLLSSLSSSNKSSFDEKDCTCAGVDLSLLSAQATEKPIELSIGAASGIQNVQYLSCSWEDMYASNYKTFTSILMTMDIYQFENEDDANQVFSIFAEDVPIGEVDCNVDEEITIGEVTLKKEYDSCLIAENERQEDYIYYVLKTEFKSGEKMLPSTHFAWQVSKDIDAFEYYVIRLYLEHPELNIDEPWITDMTTELASCVFGILSQKQ